MAQNTEGGNFTANHREKDDLHAPGHAILTKPSSNAFTEAQEIFSKAKSDHKWKVSPARYKMKHRTVSDLKDTVGVKKDKYGRTIAPGRGNFNEDLDARPKCIPHFVDFTSDPFDESNNPHAHTQFNYIQTLKKIGCEGGKMPVSVRRGFEPRSKEEVTHMVQQWMHELHPRALRFMPPEVIKHILR